MKSVVFSTSDGMPCYDCTLPAILINKNILRSINQIYSVDVMSQHETSMGPSQRLVTGEEERRRRRRTVV
jgi:hypothetical protein